MNGGWERILLLLVSFVFCLIKSAPYPLLRVVRRAKPGPYGANLTDHGADNVMIAITLDLIICSATRLTLTLRYAHRFTLRSIRFAARRAEMERVKRYGEERNGEGKTRAETAVVTGRLTSSLRHSRYSRYALSSHTPRREERREERYAIVTTTEGRSEVSERDEGSDDRPVPAVGRRQGMG